MALSLGSSLLYIGVISDSFKESVKLIFLMASLVQLVKGKKKISLFFSTCTRISPTVALSEGKLFTTVASETHWKENFLFKWNLFLILIILE